MPWFTEVCVEIHKSDNFNLQLKISGREVATGRQVAIKKIKVGQFKDGLDMSAIREVKYLREVRHSNVIEVRPSVIFRFVRVFTVLF